MAAEEERALLEGEEEARGDPRKTGPRTEAAMASAEGVSVVLERGAGEAAAPKKTLRAIAKRRRQRGRGTRSVRAPEEASGEGPDVRARAEGAAEAARGEKIRKKTRGRRTAGAGTADVMEGKAREVGGEVGGVLLPRT